MRQSRTALRSSRLFSALVIALGTLASTAATQPTAGGATRADWLQWGGPGRNFVAPAQALATSWPSGGPPKLWSRALGEGHSSILVENGRLYTMYRPTGLLSMVRRTQSEVVTALDASTGRTIWEHKYDAPTGDLDFSYGAGPHSTPLIVGSRLFAVSTLKQVFALDKATGRVLWSADLMARYGAPKAGRGYSPSPIAYGQTILLPVGGAGQSVMAFDQATGKVVWKSGSFDVAPASPLLITVDGQEQLVVAGANDVNGLDPQTGRLLWSYGHSTQYGLNISTPVWAPGNRLLISSAYDNGTRMLQLSQAKGLTSAKELWFQNRMRVHFGTIILGSSLDGTARPDTYALGASGDFGPCPTVAIDLATGRILWQDRSFARSMFVAADGKLVVLDEDGNLGLATSSPQGLKVLARAEVASGRSWTPPTLVGTRLYLRDRASIMALDLKRQ
jgi:outer membrane protein assembly factor BamB